MSDWTLEAPVAFFVFNRPETTRRVLKQIRVVAPPTLLVVADGPRSGHPADEQQCEETREVIQEMVDWDCDVRRNYADENLGIVERFTSGLEWIFDAVPEALMLEDDCVPNRDFFRFCEVMLEEYRDDERIMEVTGSNHLGDWKSDRQDYHFSYHGGIWGWATWRRAWEWYDPDMRLWTDPEVRARLRDVIGDDNQFQYLEYIYQQAYEDPDTWDYQWGFARQINSAMSIVPSKNLVTNIGFGDQATHTTGEGSDMATGERQSLDFPLELNEFVAVDRQYDDELHRLRPISHRSRLLRFARRAYDSLRDA